MKRLRGVRFFITLALIFGGGLLFTLYPGSFSFKWFGHEATLPIAFVFVIIFLLFALFLLFHHIYMWVRNIPTRSRNYFHKKREQKFEDLVLDAFESIASQEFTESELVTNLALKLRPNHPLALMLEGQTSYLQRDYAKAHTVFAKMSEIPAVRFIGLRGLAMMAIGRADVDHLESLLKQMYDLRPHSPWVLKQLSQHYLLKAKTDTSTQMLPELPFYLHMSKDEADLHQGLLLWIKYKNPENQKIDNSRKLTLLKNMHDFIPTNPVIAAAYATLQYTHVGHIRSLRTLYKTFKKAPHRILGETLLKLVQPKTALEAYKRISKICASHPLHMESCYLLGKAAFEAKLWGQVRYHLTPVLSENPSREICELMIALESHEYPDDEARIVFWKNKIHNAPYWIWKCDMCGREEESFEASCRSCGEFGSIRWQQSVDGDMTHMIVHQDSATLL